MISDDDLDIDNWRREPDEEDLREIDLDDGFSLVDEPDAVDLSVLRKRLADLALLVRSLVEDRPDGCSVAAMTDRALEAVEEAVASLSDPEDLE